MTTLKKDPDSVLDYEILWTLPQGDSISTSTWFIADPPNTGDPDFLHIDSNNHTTSAAVVWLSKGGAVGTVYTVTNRITTAGGRTDDQSIKIQIKEK